METDLFARLSACERTNRRLVQFLGLQSLLLTLLAFGSCTQTPLGSLQVTELVVVDPQGVERVRIGGDLPDAVIDGEVRPRGEQASGLLLYDGSGQERGGYVTWEPSGNVGLTLDSRSRQTTLFVAGPESGSALQLWHDNDLIELRSDSDGSRLTAVSDGQVDFQSPAITRMTTEACSAYGEAGERVSPDEVLEACRRRFTVEACDACLSEP
jgi:hypothetical protein